MTQYEMSIESRELFEQLKDERRIHSALRSRAEMAEAACAEMRAALEAVVRNPLAGMYPAQKALSSDVGKGWLPPETVAKLVHDAGEMTREGWAPPEVVAQAIEALKRLDPWLPQRGDVECADEAKDLSEVKALLRKALAALCGVAK